MSDHTDFEHAEAIRNLPPPATDLSADDVLARAARGRRDWRVPLGSVGLAAAALLVVMAWPSAERDKGTTTVFGTVHLEAAAEGAHGVRSLRRDGARVLPDERVLFRITTDRAGWLHLTESGRPIMNERQVGPGTHSPGDGSLQSWRPDDGAGKRIYAAWLCPAAGPPGDNCSRAVLRLQWTDR